MKPPRNPRVLLINRALPSQTPGGIERHVEDLAFGLSHSGCRIHLLTAPVGLPDRRRFEEAGVTLHDVPFANPARYTVRYLLLIGSRINQLLTNHRFDLIHAHEFSLGAWRPRADAPLLILTVHGTLTSETPLHRDAYRQLKPWQRPWAWGRFGRRLLYAPLWRRALKRADGLLVDSDFTRRELMGLMPEIEPKLRQVPLGVRETGPEPPAHEKARRELGWRGVQLLTVGRLEWQKGHAEALEALATLRQLDWHYTIVGAGSRAGALSRLIARLDLQRRVTLAGYVDQAHKLTLLAAADLFLWPELTHPAFGLAGLEANLAATPALATRRGAIPETLGRRGGWLVDRADSTALAQGLETLLSDPQRLRTARDGLRADTLARFSFPAMIEAVRAQYQTLSPSPPRSI
jgi:glycosyltransferase involved in cell wall biosynthesis